MIVVVVAFLASSAPTTMTNGPCFNNLRALPCSMLPIKPSFRPHRAMGYPLETPNSPGKQHGIVGNDGIGDQASALVADRYVEVCASDQFLFAADLRERGAQLMIGLDAVLGTMDVSLE